MSSRDKCLSCRASPQASRMPSYMSGRVTAQWSDFLCRLPLRLSEHADLRRAAMPAKGIALRHHSVAFVAGMFHRRDLLLLLESFKLQENARTRNRMKDRMV